MKKIIVNLNGKDNQGNTVLLLATSSKKKFQLGFFDLLLENGANILAKNLKGQNVLTICSFAGKYDLCKHFLKKGALPLINELTKDKKTALIIALEKGFIDIARVLIENGADVNLNAKIGIYPIFLAMDNGSEEIFSMLIDHNADLKSVHYLSGDTPLFYSLTKANKFFFEKIVKKLGTENDIDSNMIQSSQLGIDFLSDSNLNIAQQIEEKSK